MTSPSQRGLAVLMRHLRMTDRRRDQFHDHLLHRAPQPLAGAFHAPKTPGTNLSMNNGSTKSMTRSFDASNETRTTVFNNKDNPAMMCSKTTLFSAVQLTASREIASELSRWSILCQERAVQNVDLVQRLNDDGRTKLLMMSERFLRLSVTLAGRLEHPQLRASAIALIVRLHGNPSSIHAEPTSVSMTASDAITALNERMGQDPMTHWRLNAWDNAATKRESALLLEAFAWLAGTQAALNLLRQQAEMVADGWNDDAVNAWTGIAAFLGQGHRYLSDDGWNDRYLETQWRSNVREGVDATIDALSVESTLVAH